MGSRVQRTLFVIGLAAFLAGTVGAGAEPSQGPSGRSATEAPVGPPSRDRDLPVRLDGEELFRLQGGYVESFGPRERVANAEAALLEIARDPLYSEGLLTITGLLLLGLPAQVRRTRRSDS